MPERRFGTTTGQKSETATCRPTAFTSCIQRPLSISVNSNVVLVKEKYYEPEHFKRGRIGRGTDADLSRIRAGAFVPAANERRARRRHQGTVRGATEVQARPGTRLD